MRKRGKISAVIMGLLAVMAVMAGCEGQDQDQVGARKARLLVDENQRLKQELAGLNKQIEEKNKLLSEVEPEKTTAAKETKMIMTSLMDLMSDSEKKNVALTEENKQLKTKIEELQRQIDSLKAGH